MNDRQLNTLGHDIADKADNYLALLEMPGMPPLLSLDAMKQGLEEISKIAKELYVDVSGDDPWAK